MPSYLTIAAYRSKTTVDESLIDLCLTKGKDVQWWLDGASEEINARLAKRYAVDFNAPGPVPLVILRWLIRLVNIDVWECAGGLPEGREDGWADAARKQVYDDLEKAADAENGLYELPLRNTDALGSSAVNKGAPFVHEDATAYYAFARIAGRLP